MAFIYRKNYTLKVLSLNKATESDKQLKADGWVHIETISSTIWIEDLLNSPMDVRKEKIGDIVYKGI
jgi:hypothetical protein